MARMQFSFPTESFNSLLPCLLAGRGGTVGRLDRYILGQMLATFGFFALILVLVYWINRAVRLFDQLISDGQSALVFLEFTLMTLPAIIATVSPIAAFAAAVYVTNRMATDSELAVFHATGFSARRLARPVLVFGVIVSVLMMGLTHLIVPVAKEQLNIRQAEVAENLTARLLVEGQFLSPTDGVTFYLRDISPEGELLNVFLDDARDPAQHLTYSAGRAFLVKSDTGPKLVMIDGLVQISNDTTNQLSVTRFNDFVFDVGAMVGPPKVRNDNVDFWTSPDLLGGQANSFAPDLVSFELHNRTLAALLSLVAGFIGFAVLVSANFSRFGIWPQVFVATIMLVIVKVFESAATDFVLEQPGRVWALYTPVALGLLLGTLYLMRKDRVWVRRVKGLA